MSLNLVPMSAFKSRGTVSAIDPGPVPASDVYMRLASSSDCTLAVCHCMKMLLLVATLPT